MRAAVDWRSDLGAGDDIVAIGEDFLRIRQHEIEEQHRRVRMRRIAASPPMLLGMARPAVSDEPVDRRAFFLNCSAV